MVFYFVFRRARLWTMAHKMSNWTCKYLHKWIYFIGLSFRSFCLRILDLRQFWPSRKTRVWTLIHPILILWSLEYVAARNFAAKEETRAWESAVRRMNSMANKDALKSHHTLLQFTFTTFSRMSQSRWHQQLSWTVTILLVRNSWRLILRYLS